MNMSRKKATKLLNEIYELTSNASLTGALEAGIEAPVYLYNKIREIAINSGWIDDGFVIHLSDKTLPDDTNWMDDIGTAAKLFAKILESDDEEE
jgi:hypothetical protein